MSEAGQVHAAAAAEVPGSDLLADRLSHRIAHGRVEAHEKASLAANDAAPEGVAEEVRPREKSMRTSSAAQVSAVPDEKTNENLQPPVTGVQRRPQTMCRVTVDLPLRHSILLNPRLRPLKIGRPPVVDGRRCR